MDETGRESMNIYENRSGSMREGPGNPKNSFKELNCIVKKQQEQTNKKFENHKKRFPAYIQTPDQSHQRLILSGILS